MVMDKEREENIVAFMERQMSDESHFDYHQWDGFIEDPDAHFTEEDLRYIEKHFDVKVKLVPKTN